jgi:hypothetical protein
VSLAAPASASTTLLAAGEHSAPVTQLAARIGLSVLLLAVFAGLCALMWRGYQRRAQRQADVPAPASAAPSPLDPADGVEGVYASTTTHGDWLDRIAVHGLGVRSNAWVSVNGEGVFFVAAELAPGIAGKVTGGTGVVLVTWRLGERTLDTGFHPRAKADRYVLVDAINSLTKEGTSA